MTDREILDNAFTKIVKNSGWLSPKLKELIMKSNPQNDPFYWIFNHDFAKAFWGEESYYHFDSGSIYLTEDDVPMIYSFSNIEANDETHLIEDGNNHKGNYHWYLPIWQYHLQQMVLEEEPLKYLERFL